MHSLLAIVLVSPAVVASETNCDQQADETTLLQGTVRHRGHAHGQVREHGQVSLAPSLRSAGIYDHLAPADFPEVSLDPFDNPDLPPFTADTANFPDGLPPRPTEWTSACDADPPGNNCREKVMDEIARVLLPREIYGDKGGLCMNGDEAGYYYGAPITGSSNLWIVHLQGGGACYSMEGPSACDKEAEKIPDKFERTKRGPPNDMLSSKESKNLSPFREAHHVYLPYCTEDSWTGQVVNPINGIDCEDDPGPNTCCDQVDNPRYDSTCVDQWGFYFSGHLIFKNIIHHILSNEPAARNDMTQLLLTGSSAGGMGVLNNCDFLQSFLNELHDQDILQNEVEVKCSPQASLFFPGHTDDHEDPMSAPSKYEDFSAHQVSTPDPGQMWHDFLLHRRRFAQSCAEEYATSNWKCALMLQAYTTMQTPLFMMQNKFDYLLGQGMGSPFDPPYVESCAKKSYISYIGRAMENTLADLQSSNKIKESDGWFLASCSDHGNGIKPSFESTIVNGRDSMTAVNAWFKGDETPIILDGCTSTWGGPCNGGDVGEGCSKSLTLAVEEESCCEFEYTRLCSDLSCTECAQQFGTQLMQMGCTEDKAKELCGWTAGDDELAM